MKASLQNVIRLTTSNGLGTLVFLVMAIASLVPTLGAQTFGEAAYNFLGDYPSGDDSPSWRVEADGIAHDDNHWFIAQREALWRIPVAQDLATAAPGIGGVLCRPLSAYPELSSIGYNHFGDLDYHSTNGHGYLFVPIEGASPGVAVFRPDTLQYISHVALPGQGHAAWCAFDGDGFLYSAANFDSVSFISKYAVKWDILERDGHLGVSLVENVSLLDEGGRPLALADVQGGTFSPGGLLYLLSDREGIHVLDSRTGRRVQKSTNGYDHFNFEFDSSGWPFADQEAEGITFWNLDDGRAPHIGGQLHVILLDNDSSSPDDVYLKHYTTAIFADASYTGAESGTPAQPFDTVTEANTLAWNGADLRIKSGSYPEALTFSKRIRVTADGGPVLIGR